MPSSSPSPFQVIQGFAFTLFHGLFACRYVISCQSFSSATFGLVVDYGVQF